MTRTKLETLAATWDVKFDGARIGGRQAMTWDVREPFRARDTRVVLPTEPENPLTGATLRALETGLPPALEQLIPEARGTMRELARSTLQLQRHQDQMAVLLDEARASTRVRCAFQLALDELYTNALFNAPKVDGAHVLCAKHRRESVEIDRDVEVEFRVGSSFIGLRVRDTYGSLPPDRIIDCMQRCFSGAQAQAEQKEGGAGLGLYMLAREAHALFFNIRRGEYTEVTFIRQNVRGRKKGLSTPGPFVVFDHDENEAPAPGRRFRRYPVRWPAALRFHSGLELVHLLDVSEGGAFIAPIREGSHLHCGSEAELTVNVGDGVPVVIDSSVCWEGYHRSYSRAGLGIKFTRPCPDLVRLAESG